jgi:hypothetical protein
MVCDKVVMAGMVDGTAAWRRRGVSYAPFVVAGAVGWLTYVSLVGSYDRPRTWMFDVYFVVAIAITMLGTEIRKSRDPWALAFATVVPALVLAWWTTPRGDNDGLWILIFPILAFVFVVCGVLATLYRWLRRRRAG